MSERASKGNTINKYDVLKLTYADFLRGTTTLSDVEIADIIGDLSPKDIVKKLRAAL